MIKLFVLSCGSICCFSLCAQNIGIGTASPLGTLDVMRGTSPYGTAMFRGTTYASHFNYGNTEDTYIRGGKDGSHVYINDGAQGNVGIGLNFPPPFKLTVQTSSNNYGIVHSDGSIILGTYVGGDGGWLGTWSDHPLHFFTHNGTQQMTLLQNGNFGIGTTNPQAKLHITKDNEALRLSGSNSYLSFYDNGGVARGYLQNNNNTIILGTFGTSGGVDLRINGNLGLAVQNNGRVKVGDLACNLGVGVDIFGTLQYPKFSVNGPLGLKKSWGDQVGEWTLYYSTEPQGYLENNNDVLAFYFNGGVKAHIDDADGDYYTHSDRRLKENFENYRSVLPGIKKLDVLTYHYIADKSGRRSFGLVAQNLKEYFPEIVSGSEQVKGSYLSISYAKTGVLAIKAIQEQQVIIEEQQKKIDELEKRLSVLEQKIKR